MRLDRLLIEQGHFADARAAQGFIMAGRVVCDGVVVTKPGQAVAADAMIQLRGVRLRYASRGGYKLERALRHFQVDVRDRVVLDAGASTGGFTDCLLQAGARRVYAVDVGYGQLRGALAADPRVTALERTNVSDLVQSHFAEPIELCTVDLSYLSLLKAIPILGALFVKPVRILALVKPLYEGLSRERMDDADAWCEVLNRFFEALATSEYRARDVVVSPILGGNHAVEFLIQVDREPELGPSAEELVARALSSHHAAPPVNPEQLGESA